MRFLAQDLRTGHVNLTEGPEPRVPHEGVLVRTTASLISAGTERMLIDFGSANLLNKARQQPHRVREVLDKARTDGVRETAEAVRSKLHRPLPLGYANAGVVIEVGPGARGVAVGDVVASNGGHAEVVAVPRTLLARVPDGVPVEHACFATVGAVGLQSLRLARCELGERFAVTGLGLVGLLVVQLLHAQGCEVLGIDPDPHRRDLASALGAWTAAPGPDARAVAAALSGGRGVDGVILCATTTSSEPISEAARMCRQRGRIVLVGVTGLELDRADFYEKELTFQVSSSYGPGRYDPSYEGGADYPIGHVRWTAGRNLEAVLALARAGRIDLGAVLSREVPFANAGDAYRSLVEDPKSLGIVLRYDAVGVDAPALERRSPEGRAPTAHRAIRSAGGVAVVGAGNFATRTLIPAIAAAGAGPAIVVARNAAAAALTAGPVGAKASTDLEAVLGDPSIGMVFVATRHDSHASITEQALRAGKAVYVEKPLALDHASLDHLRSTVDELGEGGALPLLTVGFNRRFAPITRRMRELLENVTAPKTALVTVNAPALPADHWTNDPVAGGGRIIGEGCHFVDLTRFLIGHPITAVTTQLLGSPSSGSARIALGFADGSQAEILYLTVGAPGFAKERVEVFCEGRAMVNENFRRLRLHGWRRRADLRARRMDKGHTYAVAGFLRLAREGGEAPIPLTELFEVSRAVIDTGNAGSSMT